MFFVMFVNNYKIGNDLRLNITLIKGQEYYIHLIAKIWGVYILFFNLSIIQSKFKPFKYIGILFIYTY